MFRSSTRFLASSEHQEKSLRMALAMVKGDKHGQRIRQHGNRQQHPQPRRQRGGADDGPPAFTGSSSSSSSSSPSITLIQRLKDYQLQQQWARAIALFDNATDEFKRVKWKPFHYSPILDVMRRCKRTEALPRIWQFMKENPEQTLDTFTLSEALATASVARNAEIVDEVNAEIEKRGLQKSDLRVFAQKQHDKFVASNWEAALSSLEHFKTIATSIEAANGVLRHVHDPDVLKRVLADTLPEAGLVPNEESYGWLIACHGRRGDWEGALGVYSDVATNTNAKITEGPALYAQLLRALARQNQLDLCERVVVRMRDAQVPHTNAVVDAVLCCFEARSKSDNPSLRSSAWHEALSYFSAMRQLQVKGTPSTYNALVRMYRNSGVSDAGQAAQGIAQAMKEDGLQADARSHVDLINAWSNKQSRNMKRRF